MAFLIQWLFLMAFFVIAIFSKVYQSLDNRLPDINRRLDRPLKKG